MAAQKQALGVFCGPSLPQEDRLPIAGVTYISPAARGDIESAVERFEALLLIDGVFHHELAPSPKEVFAACSRAKMFGSSSMGALRAAECWPFGMIPLGIIVRWYIREIIDGDDEVALLTHPETHVALTVPMVNVRYTARLAHRRGIFSRAERADWIRAVRDIFYMDRSWEDALERAPEHARDAIRGIAKEEGDLKRWDALFALRSVKRRFLQSELREL
ncbi:MAG: TfuA-like protein [Candidatus Eremiobacteraeota bacterium]|nr:TfuA-like protein [Candidatus Eremiobacteraeota bacterium]